MTILKTAAFCLALALTAGAAQAQTGAMQSDGAMKSDSAMSSSNGMMSGDHMMAKTPSAADMRMMKSCKGMSHAMMMKNKGCMRMMKMHPDMMKKG